VKVGVGLAAEVRVEVGRAKVVGKVGAMVMAAGTTAEVDLELLNLVMLLEIGTIKIGMVQH
jgi:hypothetical protein